MITTCLFDLDGTLLPMDQEKFVKSYLARMGRRLAREGFDPELLTKAVWAGTGAMMKNDGSCPNQDLFWQAFDGVLGRDTSAQRALFYDFYRQEFQLVQQDCGFTPLAKQTIQALKAQGLRLVLATNPLFPQIATYSRIRWAGLEPEDFELVTTYENSSYCKPNPAYYREILEKLHLQPRQCLMVGNDADEDGAASQTGMQVFLLTDCLINRRGRDLTGLPQGSFPELMEYIRGLK